jgi:hypothetical protein
MQIKKPAMLFLIFKSFTWITLAVSALIIYGGANYIYNLEHAIINWDAIWYLKIAAEGYDITRKCVFFPLFPLLVKLFSVVIPDLAWNGLLLANLFCFTGIVFFYNLVRETYGEKEAFLTSVFFMAAPTSIFYVNMYTEPLFFMLTVMVFYFLNRKNWLAAAAMAGLASATRNTGFLLAIPVLWEYFSQKRDPLKRLLPAAGLCALAVSGICAFMLFLYLTHRDPLLFFNAQNLWQDRNRMTWPFAALFGRLAAYGSLFSTEVDPKRTNLSMLYFLISIALVFYGFLKAKGSQMVYFISFLALLSFQQSLLSFARFISALFVPWLILAMFFNRVLKKPAWQFLAAAVFLIWQVYINFRWMAGMWVG